MKAFDFYKLTENKLKQLAKLYEIDNLEKYYSQTDYHEKMPIKDYKDLNRVFAQLAFHAQNSSRMEPTINFIANRNILNRLTKNFDPDKFLIDNKLQDINKDNITQKENKKRIEDAAIKLTERLKSNLDRKKEFRLRIYAKSLLYSAIYVNSFNSKEAIINDLNANYQNKNAENLIKYFMKKIRNGFGVALSCDFLKEFDESFDLPKPDQHIKGTLTALGLSWTDDYDCINKMIELTNEINLSLRKKISVYQLDRMIYLVCSQNFFLDSNNSIKLLYWNQCAGKTK